MANPQKENGYTPIANEILENIVKMPLNGSQFKIVIVVWRYTYGFSRKEHDLSEKFISNATGISKRFVSSEINKLIDQKIITVVRDSTYTTPRIISFNKNYEQWCVNVQQANNPSTVEQKVYSTVEQSFTSTVEQSFHQDKQVKTNIKAKAFFENGDLNNELLEFVKTRSKMKKPMTDHAIDLLVTKLNKMADDDQTKILLLRQAIERGWQTVYPLKEQPAGNMFESGKVLPGGGVML